MQNATMLAATAPSCWRRTTTAFGPHAVARCSRRLAALPAASSAAASAPVPLQQDVDLAARRAEVQRWIASYRERTAAAAAGVGLLGWITRQRARTMEFRAKMAALGAAAVLAYGIFDGESFSPRRGLNDRNAWTLHKKRASRPLATPGITYTAAFVLSWLAYEARTGLNPTQNVKDILLLMVAMWAGGQSRLGTNLVADGKAWF